MEDRIGVEVWGLGFFVFFLSKVGGAELWLEPL
jgi:hypothetical protein